MGVSNNTELNPFLLEQRVVQSRDAIHPLGVAMLQAVPNEALALLGNLRFRGKLYGVVLGLQDDLLFEDPHLAHVVPKGLLIKQHLVVYNSHRPDIYLWGYHRIVCETLGR